MAIHPNPLSLKFVTGVIETRPDAAKWKDQYIGHLLVPDRKVGGYALTWDVVQSENGLAGIYAISGRPVPGSDKLFEQRYSEVQNVMASRVLHPTDVSNLREAGELAVTNRGKDLVRTSQRKLRDAVAWCDDTVDATKEYMIMRALQGSIAWPPNDADGNAITELMPEWGPVQIEINYPLRDVFNQAATTLVGYESRTGGGKAWTDTADSDPILDLEVIAQHIIEVTGLDAHNSTIVMPGEVMSYLATNEAIVSWIKGTEKGTGLIAIAEMMEYLETKIGYKIKLYNARWTYRTGSGGETGPTIPSVPFLDRGKILIVPDRAAPGYMAVAPSPDGKYKPGRYGWFVQDKEPPWETRVGVGEVVMPVPEHWDSIYVFDVFS